MAYNINLLPKKEGGMVVVFILFFLHYIRYILIITQFIVLGVFFFRFMIDQRIVDLKETIQTKQEIVKTTLPLINEIRETDFRLKEIGTILETQKKLSAIIQYTFSSFPESIRLTEFFLVKDMVTLEGIATNSKDLQAFYTLLKKEGRYGFVELENLKRTDEGYNFTLKLEKFKVT